MLLYKFGIISALFEL